MNQRPLPIRAALALSLLASLAAAQGLEREDPKREDPQRQGRSSRGGPTQAEDRVEAPERPGIAWFGRWADAQAEASRTQRPILLMSAAPQCSGAPGLW